MVRRVRWVPVGAVGAVAGACQQTSTQVDSLICVRRRSLPPARRRGPAPPAPRPGPRAPERHRTHRHPRPGAVGRVAPPRPAEGRRAGRRGEGRRLHLLHGWPDARAARTRAAVAALEDQFAAPPTTRSVKADDARLQEVLRLRKENFDAARRRHPRRAAARAGPQLGRLVARARPAAAAAARRRPRLRRRLPDDRSVALGVDGHRGRSVEDRARHAREALAERRAPRTSSGSAASSNSCRSRTPRSTSRCCRRRCTTRPTRPGRRARRRGSPCRAAAS